MVADSLRVSTSLLFDAARNGGNRSVTVTLPAGVTATVTSDDAGVVIDQQTSSGFG